MSEEPLTLPLVPGDDGQMYASARDVTALLRRLGTQWCDWAIEARMDAGTVEALVGSLGDLARRIDAQRTGHHPHPTEGPA
ncbi:hypothetical protein [Streptomyces sp. RKAG293]|uniref:hypothetical protein n=1 Tax=Streptomyces sp. RKAG293 TaxID=2893403 RepID=UPI0020343DAF|nr:hypothetical protein [Streptomyces sp. RKAG293]MCM2424261.1 hypothetical protein [Streptomyces sp. RKAG293]